MTTQDAIRLLQRIAQGIEKLAPAPPPEIEIKNANAYTWDGATKTLYPVSDTHCIDLSLLMGMDQARDTLLANTQQFAKGYAANNALLWGIRGMGKSALVKAIHAHINKENPGSLVLVEVRREDLATLPYLIRALSGWVIRRFIIFCDDISFDDDASYRSLKAMLEGGIEAKPDHILFYATTNRHHVPRDIVDNEKTIASHDGNALQEKISLSDRFGLWLDFHPCTLEIYLDIVLAYAKHYGISMKEEDLKQQAFLWASSRGAKSGRIAWQFIQDLAGKLNKRIA